MAAMIIKIVKSEQGDKKYVIYGGPCAFCGMPIMNSIHGLIYKSQALCEPCVKHIVTTTLQSLGKDLT